MFVISCLLPPPRDTSKNFMILMNLMHQNSNIKACVLIDSINEIFEIEDDQWLSPPKSYEKIRTLKLREITGLTGVFGKDVTLLNLKNLFSSEEFVGMRKVQSFTRISKKDNKGMGKYESQFRI